MTALLLLLWTAVLPPAANAAPPVVVSVHPSADTVPENLLRISVVFRTAPDPGVLRRIGLYAADGAAIDRPFLDQELWSPDGTTLTVLLHPGRVKSGLAARDEAGPPVRRGDDVTLRLDGKSIKAWRVGPARKDAPDPAGWTVRPPRAGSRDPVSVAFDAPIDAMAAGYIVVVSPAGEKVKGRVALAAGEEGWSLTPETEWAAGRYRLLVHPRLEDPQGNSLKSRFEQRVGRDAPDPVKPAERPFVIAEEPLREPSLALLPPACGGPSLPCCPPPCVLDRGRAGHRTRFLLGRP